MNVSVPLYEVKSKFSEYVSSVENGGVVFITKHGKTAAILVNPSDFEQSARDVLFEKRFEAWKQKYGGLSDEEIQEFIDVSESLRKDLDYRQNPFLGDE